MPYIKPRTLATAVVTIPESQSSDTVTYSVYRASDGSTFSSGTMSFLAGIQWKCTFTPIEQDTYVLEVTNTTIDIIHTQFYYVTSGVSVASGAVSTRTYSYSDADVDVRKLLTKVTDSIRSDSDVQYFIDYADNYIDSKLGAIYNVPFTSTPPLLVQISSMLACYHVLRSIKMETTTDQQNWINKLKKDADEMLMQIVKDRMRLYDSSGNLISATANEPGMISSTTGFRPIFNEGNARDWEISCDKLHGEIDEYA